MNPDPTLTRTADETADRQPDAARRPGEAASAAETKSAPARRALRRFELERSRRTAMIMLNHLAMGIDGKLFSTAQDSVDKLKDPFLAMNRMQRELRRIIAQEAQLDDEDEKRAKDCVDEDDEDCRDDAVAAINLALMAARRASRFGDLDLSQHFTMAMVDRLSKGVTGLLTGDAHDSVEKLKDPFLAMNRMQRELRRTIALAEQLDEDDAQRAKRLAAEAEAAEDAARDAERWEAGRAAREAEEAKKAAIRRAVTDAARDAWGDDTDIDDDDDEEQDDDDRESVRHLLADLFDDYETYEDYANDPAEIVAKMCAELGLKPKADLLVEAKAGGDPEAAEQAIALELARGYLERAGWAVEPAPVQDGHGPPDG
jgi:hypothetical protein